MNFESLQRFLVVAECLNFTTAADRMYIGQSTISRQIAALEQDLGVTLLIRGPRSVELTDAGKVLQQEGTKLLRHVSDVRDKVADAANGSGGRVRISTVPAYFQSLNMIYVSMMSQNPEISVQLSHSKNVNLCLDLDADSADIGISYSFLNPFDPAYETINLEHSQLYVLCSKHHWIANHPDGIYLDDLRDTDIIFGRASVQMLHNPTPYHGEPNSHISEQRSGSHSIEGDLLSMQYNNNVIILPGASALNSRHNLMQIPILDEDLKHYVTVFYRKDNDTKAVHWFVQCAKEYLAANPL